MLLESPVTAENGAAETGTWLTGEWHTPAGGGFDGRWVALFEDRH